MVRLRQCQRFVTSRLRLEILDIFALFRRFSTCIDGLFSLRTSLTPLLPHPLANLCVAGVFRCTMSVSKSLTKAAFLLLLLLGYVSAAIYCPHSNARIPCCKTIKAKYDNKNQVTGYKCNTCDSGFKLINNGEQCSPKLACKKGYGPSPVGIGKPKCVKCSDKNCADCHSVVRIGLMPDRLHPLLSHSHSLARSPVLRLQARIGLVVDRLHPLIRALSLAIRLTCSLSHSCSITRQCLQVRLCRERRWGLPAAPDGLIDQFVEYMLSYPRIDYL